MRPLKLSTEKTVRIGPYVDKTDGVTSEAGLAGAGTEISKAGGAFGTGPTLGTYDSDGWYPITLTTSHTDTIGELVVKGVDDATHLPVWETFTVLPAVVFDALFAAAATDYLQVDVVQIAGAAVSTSSAQLGVNVVNAADTAWGSGAITAASLAADAGTEIATAVWASADRQLTALDEDVTAIDINGQAVGSVVGAVGSVTGNVGGNVVGSVGSVTGAVGSVTGNVGGNVVGSVGSVTGAVGSVTGNVGGNVVGSVASVVGAVGSVGAGGIAAATFAAGAIDAAAIATGAIDADAIADNAIDAGAIATGAITAAKFASAAIDAAALAPDAGTEIGTAVWASAARTLTAATNVTSTGAAVPITAGGYVSADVKAINAVAVDGAGTAGDPWGPV